MTRLLVAVLLLLFLAGCSQRPAKERTPAEGELAYTEAGAHDWLAVRGTILHRNVGASVYSVDVSDPRKPRRLDYRAYSAGCTNVNGFVVKEDLAYMGCHDEVAEVPLPQASLPNWVWELPDPDDYYLLSMVDLPNDDGFVVARLAEYPLNGTGDLILAYDELASSSRVMLDFIPTNSIRSGTRLVTRSVADGGDSLVVFDTTDPGMVAELARIPFEDVYGNRELVIRDLDLFGMAIPSIFDEETRPSRITWHRFDPTFTSLQRLSFVDEPSRRGAGFPPALSGEFLFVPSSVDPDGPDDEVSETVVLHLDSAGLQVVRRIPAGHGSGFIGHIVVDEERDLLFVGGGGIQILDLCAVTTGDVCWP